MSSKADHNKMMLLLNYKEKSDFLKIKSRLWKDFKNVRATAKDESNPAFGKLELLIV